MAELDRNRPFMMQKSEFCIREVSRPTATMGKRSISSYLTLDEVKQRADHVSKLSRMMQRRA
jgi:hypothetical protein